MFCYRCGTKLADQTRFCHQCGTAMNAAEPVEPVSELAPSNRPGAPPAVAAPQPDPQAVPYSDGPQYLVNSMRSPSASDASTDKATGTAGNANTVMAKLRGLSRKQIVAIATVAVIVAAVGLGAGYFNQRRHDAPASNVSGTSTAPDAGSSGGDTQAEPEQSRPIVDAIVTNCSQYSTTTVSVQYTHDKYYAAAAIVADSDTMKSYNVLACIAEQAGLGSQSDDPATAYATAGSLLTELTQYGAKNVYGVYVSDIAETTWEDLSSSTKVRCMVNLTTPPSLSCQFADANLVVSSGDGSDVAWNGEGSSTDTGSSGAASDEERYPGYEQYKDSMCAAGNSGRMIACSEIKAVMDAGLMNPLPFGKENNRDPTSSFTYIPVDVNGNGVIDEDEGGL